MEEELPLEHQKDDNFSEWYSEVIEKAELCDKRYPVKGMNVWRPYGWKIMLLIDEHIREEMKRTGHEEVNFPLLIPEEQFKKESEHIKGFSDEVFWVHHAGGENLDVPLLLRPTSETAMYPMFALWIRSHADLPLKIFQIVNVFRYDTKQTRAFIRMREFHFFEAHTCHVDEKDAEMQIKEDMDIMMRLSRRWCLPYIMVKRPEWDKFPGAYYSLACDTFLPSGRSLQLGTFHHYRDNFAHAYEIKYEDADGTHKYVHQTTYGMSERLVGGIIGIHGDNRGLMLPPDVAPWQVVIVPILSKEVKKEIIDECRNMKEKFEMNGIRVYLDERDIRPGNKFYYWELRGVPLRVEIGPKDFRENTVTFSRRDTLERKIVDKDDAVDECKHILKEIQSNLWRKAEEFLKNSMKHVDSVEEAIRQSGKSIIYMEWCGDEKCAGEIEVQTGMSILGTPIKKTEVRGKCRICGIKDARYMMYAAKSY